jgi:predicted RNase H-like HicB family nuclease
MESYTAKYVKIARGYMGQIIEWPEVVTEGSNLEECREMLRDALSEMIAAYRQMGKPIPRAATLFEQFSVDVDSVHQTA